jgi:hypothetical protein
MAAATAGDHAEQSAPGGLLVCGGLHHLPIRWLNDETFVDRMVLMVNRHAGPPASRRAGQVG